MRDSAMSPPRIPIAIENLPVFRQIVFVKFAKFLIPAMLAAFCAGCHKAKTAETPPASGGYLVPTHAQAKLPTIKIYLGPQTLDAEMAVTSSEEATGLMYRTNITDDTAMIFVLSEPILPPDGFWMTNCPISLSAAYIGPDGVIEEIHHLEKNDPVPVVASNNNIIYVLEVNDGWFARHNINVGTLITTERGSLAGTFRR